MNFGQHRNKSVGLVYLFVPTYIDWALRTTDLCISNIDDIINLCPINNDSDFCDLSDCQDMLYSEIVDKNFDFIDLVFMGNSDYRLSDEAKEQNEYKLFKGTFIKKKLLGIDPNEQIFYPQLFLPADIKIKCFFIGKRKTSMRSDIGLFEFDNSSYQIKTYPNKKIKIGVITDSDDDDFSIGELIEIKTDNSNLIISSVNNSS